MTATPPTAELERDLVRLLTEADTVSYVIKPPPSNVVVHVTANIERLTGWTAAQILSSKDFWRGLMHADDRQVMEEAKRTLDETGHAVCIYRIRRRDGEWTWVRSESFARMGDDGKPRYYAGFFVDVSALKQATEVLAAQTRTLTLAKEAAEAASRAKSDFLASMSHELRTPLSAVMGMLDLLRGSKLDEEQHRRVDIAHDAAKGLLGLLNDTLDFSKVEAGKLELEGEDVDVPALVNDVIELFRPVAASKKLRLEALVEAGMARDFVTDPARLRQILFNLVGNAVKFTEAGGHVAISANLKDDRLRFEVRDSGIGISPEQQALLFQPFTQVDASSTRRFAGTGLGLAICKRLAEAMGGEIGVTSELGKGSLFWFEIKPMAPAQPRLAPPQKPAVASPTAPVSGKGPLDILVVEDNAINQHLILALLQRDAHRTQVAANGVEGVAAASKQRFDVILMDIQMPVMDGMTAAGEIRKLPKPYCDVPIIALTANAVRGDRERYLAAGMDDYVSKPIDVKALREAIARASHGPALAAAG